MVVRSSSPIAFYDGTVEGHVVLDEGYLRQVFQDAGGKISSGMSDREVEVRSR